MCTNKVRIFFHSFLFCLFIWFLQFCFHFSLISIDFFVFDFISFSVNSAFVCYARFYYCVAVTL